LDDSFSLTSGARSLLARNDCELRPMTKELELRLIERWPAWFNVTGDLSQTLMPFGFQHGDGWFRIVWRLCEDLEPLIAKAENDSEKPFEVLQVKEKLGTLRFYVSHHTDEIDERIANAQTESTRNCEICGQCGSLHDLKTRCEEHQHEG
jgi:hypothetical protein